MQSRDVLMRLLFMDARDAESAINAAFREYASYLADIYNDIYNSCIQLYYSKYDPTVYDRHGDPEGFNLYRASDIYSSDLLVNMTLDAWNLLPYNGKEKRDRVLDTVLDGIRGGGARTQQFRGWPRPWTAYYPNEFSQYADWSSSKRTLDDILYDFAQNGVQNTSDKFWELIANNI